MRNAVNALLLLCVLVFGSCGKPGQPPQEVVAYVSVDDEYARPIAELFSKRTGIAVRLVPDSEETKSTGLINRLIAEAPRPRADVFWSGDPVRASILKRRGLAQQFRRPNAAELPARFSDKDGYFTGFAARLRIIIYNRNLVREDELPKSLSDLLQPRFSFKACVANPLFGTTSMHAAALFQQLGDARAQDFFNQLRTNGVQMLSSNGEVRRRVAAGDFMIGLTDSDDVSTAIKDGQPVGFVIPDQAGDGTVLIPCATVLIKGGPNPENGKKLIAFLVSEEVERLMAQSEAAHLPLRPSVPPPALFKQGLAGIRVMNLDYDLLAEKLEALNGGFLRDWVAKGNSSRPN